MKRYFENFSNIEDVYKEFGIDKSELSDDQVIYASYDQSGYEGDAIVLFRKDGELYEVHGSHCSCYDLIGQFNSTRTTYKALMDRPNIPKEAKENLFMHFN